MSNADDTTKVSEIGAAAHADVLASIDRLSAGGIGERTSPSAHTLPRLKQGHGEAARRQCRRRRQSCQSCSDDRHALRHDRCSPVGMLSQEYLFHEKGLAKREKLFYKFLQA